MSGPSDLSDLSDLSDMDDLTEAFVAHRSLLFTVAYEMLGSAADAEDVVQDTWLRWAAGDGDRDDVQDPRAYLVRIATRLALNRLRALSRRKETYVGPWLPEPLLTAPDVAEDVELAESLSTAMLLVLETLGPTERAVFVLREVFDVPYDDIAEAVGKSPAAVRQIAHRAREHVAARRPRTVVDRAQKEAVLERFLAAASGAGLQGLLDVLAPDVVLVTDGGGLKKAALRPIEGAEKILRFLEAVTPAGVIAGEMATVNGEPAVKLYLDGELDSVVTVEVEDGVATRVFFVRNPEKLGRVDGVVPVAR